MRISENQYRIFTRLIGGVLTLYGGGALITYLILVVGNTNELANFTNEMGTLFLALMGAFSLPLGVSLFKFGADIQSLMNIAAFALGINGLIRIAIFLNPELLVLTGATTPIFEFVIFIVLGLASGLVKGPQKQAVN